MSGDFSILKNLKRLGKEAGRRFRSLQSLRSDSDGYFFMTSRAFLRQNSFTATKKLKMHKERDERRASSVENFHGFLLDTNYPPLATLSAFPLFTFVC